jgi:hypothetical protein
MSADRTHVSDEVIRATLKLYYRGVAVFVVIMVGAVVCNGIYWLYGSKAALNVAGWILVAFVVGWLTWIIPKLNALVCPACGKRFFKSFYRFNFNKCETCGHEVAPDRTL